MNIVYNKVLFIVPIIILPIDHITHSVIVVYNKYIF